MVLWTVAVVGSTWQLIQYGRVSHFIECWGMSLIEPSPSLPTPFSSLSISHSLIKHHPNL